MCLIAFSLNPIPDICLILAANRDEFHQRATSPLMRWQDAPDVIAGRDLEAGGTWLGISERGYLAAVTNVREPTLSEHPFRSRGALAAEFLMGEESASQAATRLQPTLAAYGPCNLLLIDGQKGIHLSNRPQTTLNLIQGGVHALSNAALDTPWPKTRALSHFLTSWLSAGSLKDYEPLFQALRDTKQPPDSELPDTGVGLDRERFVAPMFIRSKQYGTRCSTVICVRADGHGDIIERRFGPDGIDLGESHVQFSWPVK